MSFLPPIFHLLLWPSSLPPLFFKLPVWTSRGALLEGLREVAPFLSLGSPEAIKSSGEEAGDLLEPRSPLVMI